MCTVVVVEYQTSTGAGMSPREVCAK
jgi:hypothetical protein